MNQFLSCDWGTSSLRLKLVNADDYAILGGVASDKGILGVFHLWKAANNEDEQARLHYFLQVIDEHIRQIEQDLNISADGIPLVISGMASSSIGMVQLPYGDIPFPVNGRDINTRYYPARNNFRHSVVLISGIKSSDDVMRGEETQLMGCISGEHGEGNHLYIFPGTHSKHIIVNNGYAVGFKTYMTGEVFALLSTKSILQEAVENLSGDDESFMEKFELGVEESRQSNLLHACFKVRTNNLFHKMSKGENYRFLSGLLIGAELSEIINTETSGIYLCCASVLKPLYESALRVLGIHNHVKVFPAAWVEEAVIRGQSIIFKETTLHE